MHGRQARVVRIGAVGRRRRRRPAGEERRLVDRPELRAERRGEAAAAVVEHVGGEDDETVRGAEPRLVGAGAPGRERVDLPAARRVGGGAHREQDGPRVLVRDRGEPPAREGVVEDPRVGEVVGARAEEVGELEVVRRLGPARARPPHASGEVHELDDGAGPRGDLDVGRVVAAADLVVQAVDRLRHRHLRQRVDAHDGDATAGRGSACHPASPPRRGRRLRRGRPVRARGARGRGRRKESRVVAWGLVPRPARYTAPSRPERLCRGMRRGSERRGR